MPESARLCRTSPPSGPPSDAVRGEEEEGASQHAGSAREPAGHDRLARKPRGSGTEPGPLGGFIQRLSSGTAGEGLGGGTEVDVTTWNLLFKVAAIVGGSVALTGAIGTLLTDRVIQRDRAAQIQALSPRRLTPEQTTKLSQALGAGKASRVGFVSRMLDGESGDYADSLAAVFRTAGWEVVVPTNRVSLNDLPGFLLITVTSNGLESTATFIRDRLQAAGLDVRFGGLPEGSFGGQLELDTVYIVVGRKQ